MLKILKHKIDSQDDLPNSWFSQRQSKCIVLNLQQTALKGLYEVSKAEEITSKVKHSTYILESKWPFCGCKSYLSNKIQISSENESFTT